MTRDVLLLHGLWMSRVAMLPLATRLAAAGFRTHTLTYRSVARDLRDHLLRIDRAVAGMGTEKLHIVAHSMGGLVALAYLAQARQGLAERLVLLGSPVAGCLAGRTLASHPSLGAVLGASAALWRDHRGLALPKGVEACAIAGTGRIGIGRFFVALPEANDGVVMVAETRLPGLAAHLVLPVSHSAMLVAPRVAAETVHFLRHGCFRHPA
jgi:pimeloyl-ACP methyl ester carboxylesterase